MSYPYFVSDQAAAADPHNLNFSVYDPRYVHAPGGPLGASPHLNAGGFWYRSDLSDSQYGNGVSDYGRGMQISVSENIKHRRTRSGCFTCRSRRVKCDETRPICDRCRKGNRQCDFPPPPSTPSKKPKHSDSRAVSSHSSQPDREEKETSPVTGLETIKDESEDEAIPDELPQTRPRLDSLRTNSTHSLTRKQKWRQHSEVSVTSSASKEKATTPSTDSSSSHSRSQTPSSSLQTNPPISTAISRQSRWADRRIDLQKYLQYHDEHITFYHYFLKFDMEDFIHTELIDLALTYEPLLYAVVAFAAYQHTLRQPDGHLANFLSYYSKSLSLLMKSLAKGTKSTEATLLTVLQLTTFEEYLGDWVSLVSHHRAAHYMLLELYTPETIMETEVNRQILAWYARFDVVAGLMAGNEPFLDRKWYTACSTWFEDHADPEDVDIDFSLQYIIAKNRLIAMDIAALFSKLEKGAIDMKSFQTDNATITQDLHALKSRIEGLNDSYYTVTEFPYQVPLTADDIVNPYVPGGLFRDAFWPLNYAWCDWYGIMQMHTYQTSVALGQSMPAELEQMSLEQCRVYDAIDRYPDAPQGANIAAHTSLALASVFLKKDNRHIMWARRKLSMVERLGYVFPPTFRQKMAELWNVPEVEHWWLPNEEGHLPILKEIRKLIEERVRQAREQNKGGGPSDDLRDIKAIFSRMNISGGTGSGEESSPGSAGSVAGATPPSSSGTIVTAGSLAKEAGVTGMLSGIWPSEILAASGAGASGSSSASGSARASSTGTLTVPVPMPVPVQKRRQSQEQVARRASHGDDRMSWVGQS